MNPENKTVNRRLRIRRACNIPVYLRSPVLTENKLAKLHTTNISNKGAFIKCTPTMFAKDMLLYLVFTLEIGKVVKLHRLSASVTRVEATGIAVRFLTNGPDQKSPAHQDR